MTLIKGLTSFIPNTIAQETEAAAPQTPTPSVSSTGIAANPDHMEIVAPSFFDPFQQQPPKAEALNPSAANTTIDASSMFEHLGFLEIAPTPDTGMDQLKERLNSLKERASELKTKISALEKEIMALQQKDDDDSILPFPLPLPFSIPNPFASSNGDNKKLIELLAKMEELKSELSKVESEIKSVLKEIEEKHTRVDEDPYSERMSSSKEIFKGQVWQEALPDPSVVRDGNIPLSATISPFVKKPDED